ncbi:aldo/keto reductase [candidate division KSB1 bacterium]|nr:aldo/keto reductase [candidate division KSB1 bacterium]
MKLNRLGKSELMVSEIGFGCWVFSNDREWGAIDENEALNTVHVAIDAGVNFFDTAEGYGRGHSEKVLGKALAGRREKVIISTKVSGKHLAADELPTALEDSLRRLQTDYIDLYTIHWPSRTIPFEETVNSMLRAKEQGKIRHIGVSNFGVGDLTDIVELSEVAANQVPYNLFWRMLEAGILQKCIAENISIVAYSPLAQGLLTGKFKTASDIPEGNRAGTRLYRGDALALAFEALSRLQAVCSKIGAALAPMSLAWLIQQPGVGSVIPGARNRAQLSENLKAAEVRLSEEIVAELREISQPLFDHLGSDPDMWGGNRYR